MDDTSFGRQGCARAPRRLWNLNGTARVAFLLTLLLLLDQIKALVALDRDVAYAPRREASSGHRTDSPEGSRGSDMHTSRLKSVPGSMGIICSGGPAP